MYNVMLVDDEITLVNSLYEYINRNHSNEYECIKAYSARQALELATHIRMDIAVLDIEMPGMNGMELRERLERLHPYCRVIFLTAYDRFDYAYAAVQQRKTRFLLKTEGYGTVLNVIREESQALDDELMQMGLVPGQQAGQIPGYGRNDFLRLLVSGNIDADSTKQEAARYDIVLDVERDVMPVLLRLFDEGRSYTEEKAALVRVFRFFSGWFADKYEMVFIQLSREYALFLLQPLAQTDVQADLKQDLELIVNKAVQVAGRRISLALADDWTGWDKLPQKLDLMRERLDNAPDDGDDYICQLDGDALKKAELLAAGDRLVAQMQQYDEARIRATMHESIDICRRMGTDPAEFLFRQLERVQLKRTWSEWECGYKQMAQFACMLEQDPSGVNLVNVALDFARGFDLKRSMHNRNELKRAVCMTNEYISAHYAEDISLADMAGHVCLSSSYLSRIYKKETGMSTVDKLKEVRIKAAIRLLETTNMKIQDVAAAVGYNSPRYFLSVFRSITGVGPTEYREGRQ